MRVFLGGLGIVAALTLAPFALADQVYHSQHIPLVPVTATSPGGGFVENTHANGPVNYAHEIYVLQGALPNTTYTVTLSIYGDSNCGGLIASLTTARVTRRSRLPKPTDSAGTRSMCSGR